MDEGEEGLVEEEEVGKEEHDKEYRQQSTIGATRASQTGSSSSEVAGVEVDRNAPQSPLGSPSSSPAGSSDHLNIHFHCMDPNTPKVS